jgi:8-oxo-dGTP pyrophosphatase MutT (NUDIX family)
MYKWLPKHESLIIPPYSHTMVGVGALVINDKNEVLVVSERNALIPGSWKLPGGYLERDENLEDAAIREVFEETHIETSLESLVSIRHAHGAGFGCSDLYLVFALKPLSTEIKKCDREISECKWMPIDEYLAHPNVHQTNRSFVQQYLYNKQNGIQIVAEDGLHQILKKKYKLYFAKTN